MQTTHYYELEHPQYGIWYATSLLRAAKIIDCSKIYIYNRIKLTDKIKGWKITEIPDIDDIPFKWINQSRETVLNNKFNL